LNGWIKEELLIDFKLERYRTKGEVKVLLGRYVKFYNEQRPCWAIGYDIPNNYRRRFYKGKLEHKNTFESRALSAEPKFVRKRREQAHL
jgi:putative transposase